MLSISFFDSDNFLQFYVFFSDYCFDIQNQCHIFINFAQFAYNFLQNYILIIAIVSRVLAKEKQQFESVKLLL